MGTEKWNEFEREVKQENSVSTTKMDQKRSKDNFDKQEHLQNSSSNKTQECYCQQSTWRTLQGPLAISLCNNIRCCPDLMTRSFLLTVEKQDDSTIKFSYMVSLDEHFPGSCCEKKIAKLIQQQTGDFIWQFLKTCTGAPATEPPVICHHTKTESIS